MGADSAAPAALVSERLKITTRSQVEVFCPKDSLVCARNIFIFYPEINHSNYKIEIELDTRHTHGDFRAFSFSAVTANSKYTMFLLLLRYSLFILSVLMSSRYFKFYWSLNPLVRTFEHKALFWLSTLLIFFNDPFYAATILKSNLFFSILSTLFVCAFLAAMVLFWVVMLQRIHREPATPESKICRSKSTKLLGGLTRRRDLPAALRQLLDRLGGLEGGPLVPHGPGVPLGLPRRQDLHRRLLGAAALLVPLPLVQNRARLEQGHQPPQVLLPALVLLHLRALPAGRLGWADQGSTSPTTPTASRCSWSS